MRVIMSKVGGHATYNLETYKWSLFADLVGFWSAPSQMGRHRHKKVSDKDAEENITKQLIESGKREELKNMVNTLGLKLYNATKIILNKHIIQV